MNFIRNAGIACVMGLMVATAQGQLAIGTAFTYQGQLKSSGTVTSGLHDFRFKIYQAVAGGTPIGATLCVDNVNVNADGTFTTQLDFGDAFGSRARFLEIEVRRDTGLSCANATGFALLTPRQQMNPAPIAMHAVKANALDAPDGNPVDALFVGNSGYIGIGTTDPLGPLDVRSANSSYFRIDAVNGDLHFNGGADGFFGFYNDAAATGRTEFASSGGVNLSIGNNGSIGMGALPVAGTRLKAVGTVEADEFRFATAKTIYISVDATGLTPVVGETVGSTANGRYTSGSNPIAASVSLPDGMVITEIRWFVGDTSSGADLSLNLYRQPMPKLPGAPWPGINQVFTSGTPGITTLSAAMSHTVNNQDATYYVMALPRTSGDSWDSGRIGVQGVTIVGTIRTPR